MWIVYNKEDSWQCGWSVNSEQEAIAECERDKNLTYKYIGFPYGL